MKNLTDRPLFRKIARQRSIYGWFSNITSVAFLYFVLSIQITPALSESTGTSLTISPWQGEEWWQLSILCVVLFVLTLSQSRLIIQQKGTQQLYPVLDDDITEIAGLPAQKIIDLTLNLSKKMNVKVDYIFWQKNPTPNAFTAFSLGWGNFVFLYSNLVEIMDEDSVESVLAHELGHIRGNDIFYRILNLIPRQISTLWLLLLNVKLIGVALLSEEVSHFFARIGIVLLFFAGTGLGLNLLMRLERVYARKKEQLADSYQTYYTSIEASINTFLRLNERSHTLKAFIIELKEQDASINPHILHEALRIFPSGPMTKERIKKEASYYYGLAQLNLLNRALSIELPQTEQEKIIQTLLQYRTKTSKAESSGTKPFVWQDFDWNHDGKLQKNELIALLQSLRENPFALTSDEEKDAQHPAVRDRILFLAELFEDELHSTQ